MGEQSQPECAVKHVALIMDGNGRWAKAQNKARLYGHRQGVKTVRRIVEHSVQIGLKSLTLYAFSSENWKRPKAEVTLLFELLSLSISEQLDDLHKNNVRLRVIGDLQALPKRLSKKIQKAADVTADNNGLILNIALNYGARWELANAAKNIAKACQAGQLSPEQVDEAVFDSYLTTSGQADLDLLIRTGGERRLSNFLLWQAAYAELYFTDIYWPDFNEAEMDAAIEWFAGRKRRFGKIDEQL